MHHIAEAHRADALAEMYRVLRPGGRLLLADTHPTGPVLPTVVRVMARFAAHRTHDHSADRSDPLASVDIRRYQDTLRATGFENIRFHTIKPLTGVLLATKP